MVHHLLHTVLANGNAPPPGGGIGGLLLPMLAIFALFYFLILRPQRQEQRRHEAMLKALKKNDRVVAAGGILGTVSSISPNGQEVTLKVDDNTRLRVLRSSIQTVLKDEAQDSEA